MIERAFQVWETPCVAVVPPLITKFGPVFVNIVIPFGAPTPLGPS